MKQVLEATLRLLEAGGPLMYANVATLAVALVLTVERAAVLRLRYGANAAPFLRQIRKLLEVGNRDRALQLSAAVHGSPLAELLRTVLAKREGDGTTLEQALAEQRPLIEKRIGWLWSLANVAMLVGVVGAGLELIRSSLPNALLHGLSGLTVALLCALSHVSLRAWARRIHARLERQIRALAELAARGGSKARMSLSPDGSAAAPVRRDRALKM